MFLLMTGLPASGKTTLARRLQDLYGGKILHADQIRLALTGSYGDSDHDLFVWEVARRTACYYLEQGIGVIYDATNSTKEQRRPWLDLACQLQLPLEAIWVDRPLEVCLKQNLGRENTLPDWVIEKVHSFYTPPDVSEGFAKVHRVCSHELPLIQRGGYECQDCSRR